MTLNDITRLQIHRSEDCGRHCKYDHLDDLDEVLAIARAAEDLLAAARAVLNWRDTFYGPPEALPPFDHLVRAVEECERTKR